MAKEFEVRSPRVGWLHLHEIVDGEGEEVHVQCPETDDTRVVEAALREAGFKPRWETPGRLIATLGRD